MSSICHQLVDNHFIEAMDQLCEELEPIVVKKVKIKDNLVFISDKRGEEVIKYIKELPKGVKSESNIPLKQERKRKKGYKKNQVHSECQWPQVCELSDGSNAPNESKTSLEGASSQSAEDKGSNGQTSTPVHKGYDNRFVPKDCQLSIGEEVLSKMFEFMLQMKKEFHSLNEEITKTKDNIKTLKTEIKAIDERHQKRVIEVKTKNWCYLCNEEVVEELYFIGKHYKQYFFCGEECLQKYEKKIRCCVCKVDDEWTQVLVIGYELRFCSKLCSEVFESEIDLKFNQILKCFRNL